MDVWPLFLFIIGLGVLTLGAEVLVRGASRLAVSIGVSSLVVGLTIVSFGTSSPELAVSLQSALAGQADIALGNVIGSNIFNVLIVLGLCAIIIPLLVSYQLIRLDVPIMIGAAVLTLLLSLDGRLGRLDGFFLFVGLLAYVSFTIWQSRKEHVQDTPASVPDPAGVAPPASAHRNLAVNIGLIVVGLGLLVAGSNWMVQGAVIIAQAMGISPLIIGLTIVAAGTSLPEVATSVVAAFRGERDIAVGNVVGSCIFNLFGILGLTALVSPVGINVPSAAIWFDIPVMIAVSIACLPIFFTGFIVSRQEGWMLLGYYGIYLLFLTGLDVLSAIVLISFVIAPVGLFLQRDTHKISGWVLAALPLMLFVLFCTRIPAVMNGAVFTETTAWAANMGVTLSFYLDGLSLLFAMIITGIGTLIVLYTSYYLADDPGIGRFYFYLLIFMGSMLGVVLANNILTMFIFWELTSASSYLLIGFKHEYPEARRGAQQGLLITAGGGLALLFGLLILGEAAKAVGVDPVVAYNLDAIIAAGEDIKVTAFYTPALILIFLGCFTKSAQFPFHFWLPNAMQAPTPASAFLHSATMVKAGIYLLARLNPGLGETALWNVTLTVFGAVTLLLSSVLALRQSDLKALLAYSTVSVLGILTMLIGLGGHYAMEAMVAYLLAHALYKSALFMVAGGIDHETGTRDLSILGGLRKDMPVSMVLTAITGLSMAGLPIAFGFFAKELVLKAATESPLHPLVSISAVIVLMVSAAFAIAYTWRLFNGAFLGDRAQEMKEHVHEAPVGMLIGPGVPAALTASLFLVLPAVNAFLSPAATAVAGESIKVHLHLWEGINLPFFLTLMIIAAGIVLARFERQFATAPSRLPVWLNADRIYDSTLNGILNGSKMFTVALQSGKLRIYVAIIIITFLVLTVPLFLFYGTNGVDLVLSAADLQVVPHELVIPFMIIAGVVATIWARSRVGAIISLGVVGAMISLFFVLFSAPDLALTQLLVEVLLTVFLLFVFSVLPARFESLGSRGTHIRDGIIAISVGGLMAGLSFVAATSESFMPVSSFFLEESIPGGKGENVVNVILVDFRGLDTLGEITVLFIATLGIFGLLRLRHTKADHNVPSTLGEPLAEPSFDESSSDGGAPEVKVTQ